MSKSSRNSYEVPGNPAGNADCLVGSKAKQTLGDPGEILDEMPNIIRESGI